MYMMTPDDLSLLVQTYANQLVESDSRLERLYLLDALTETIDNLRERLAEPGVTPPPPKIVRVKYRPQTASGRREGWAKVVTGLIEGQKFAKGIAGPYLRAGVETDVQVGALVLEVNPMGSVKNSWQQCRICRMSAQGDLEEIETFDWSDDQLSIRDKIVELLGA